MEPLFNHLIKYKENIVKEFLYLFIFMAENYLISTNSLETYTGQIILLEINNVAYYIVKILIMIKNKKNI